MAKPLTPKERAAKVEQTRREMGSLLGAGYSYQKARREMILRDPSLARGKILEEAEAKARNDRRLEAGKRIGESLKEYHAREKVRKENIRETASQLAAIDIIQYHRQGAINLGEADSGVRAHYRDPFTGERRTIEVWLPIPVNASDEAIASRVAKAVSQEMRRDDYETIAALYAAIRGGITVFQGIPGEEV